MIDATTRERLQDLRLLLEEAQRRAADSTRLGRHAALILLDGSVEFALLLAAAELGEPPKTRFPEQVRVVTEALGSGVTLEGLKGIGELHGMRNEAQHRGTRADGAQLPRWSTDAERFIGSVVAAVFRLNLRDVLVADAISDADLRQLLSEAETALADDPLAAFDGVVAAFNGARCRWRAQREQAMGYDVPLPAHRLGDLTTDYVRKSLEALDDANEVFPFAPDLGEYFWLRVVRKNRNSTGNVSREEARRAFAFVLNWILRWEAFAARYTQRVYAEWQRAGPPPPRTGAENPTPLVLTVLTELEEERLGDGDPSVTVVVQLADLPDENGLWIRCMRLAFKEEAARAGEKGLDLYSHVLSATAELRVFRVPLAPPDGGQHLLDAVGSALVAANRCYDDVVARRAAWEAAEERLLAPYRRVFSSLTLAGEALFGAARAEPVETFDGSSEQGFHGEVDLRTATDDAAHLGYQLWQALNEQGLIGPNAPLDVSGRDDAHLSFTSEFTALELEAALRAALEKIASVRAAAATAARRRADAAATLERGLRDRLRKIEG